MKPADDQLGSRMSARHLAEAYVAWQAGRGLGRHYAKSIERALASLSLLHGDVPADYFTVEMFEAVREHTANHPRPRSGRPTRRPVPARLSDCTVDNYMDVVVGAFRWGAGEGTVDHRVYNALMDVPQWGTSARRMDRDPATLEAARATLRFMPFNLRTAVLLMVYLDCAGSELASLRSVDIDRSMGNPTVRARCRQCRKGSGPCNLHAFWYFRAGSTGRTYRLDLTAQGLLAPLLDIAKGDPATYLFTARHARVAKGRPAALVANVRQAIAAARGEGFDIREWQVSRLRGYGGTLLEPIGESDLPEAVRQSSLIRFRDVAGRLPWVGVAGLLAGEQIIARLTRWHRKGIRPAGVDPFAEPVRLTAVRDRQGWRTSEAWLRSYFAAMGWPTEIAEVPAEDRVRLADVPARFPWVDAMARRHAGYPLTPQMVHCWSKFGRTGVDGLTVRLGTVPNCRHRSVTIDLLLAFFKAVGWPVPGERVADRTNLRHARLPNVPAHRRPRVDPERPDVALLPVAGKGIAVIDAADKAVADGLLWCWSWGAGRASNGRVMTMVRGRRIALARLILGVTDPRVLVTYEDGDPTNLRRGNLRACCRAELSSKSWAAIRARQPGKERP